MNILFWPLSQWVDPLKSECLALLSSTERRPTKSVHPGLVYDGKQQGNELLSVVQLGLFGRAPALPKTAPVLADVKE